MGLRLSPEKTLITQIYKGLDFLGWRIQRHRKRGSNRHYDVVSRGKFIGFLWQLRALAIARLRPFRSLRSTHGILRPRVAHGRLMPHDR
ncbi:hypothetical protein ACIF80_36235 [Streptomyces sp. NPDC085927]|uniref:hypothetical protein n=1 Tax=Streptomyces sp. NPDC085927 TaxID=3365738 RepID=UPI0037D4A99D